MIVIFDKEKQKVPILSWCEAPEEGAVAQAVALCNHPAVMGRVCLMPDTHLGYGMPIGGVVMLDTAISPNLVGVDIGCGMGSLQTGITLEQFQGKKGQILKILRTIPLGFHHRENCWIQKESSLPLRDLAADSISNLESLCYDHTENGDERLGKRKFWETIRKETGRDLISEAVTALGTLGGGNHFIEIQKDKDNMIYIMLHSGSRNLGKQIADVYNRLAKDACNRWKVALPNDDLAFFPFDSDLGQEYFEAMSFALRFAYFNRLVMLEVCIEAFGEAGFELDRERIINIHHNYAALETHEGKKGIVHRKGATFAGRNTTGIIPGSMGTPSYIVKGLGNAKSFMSCSHGAGRRMGRAAAKRQISLEDYQKSMEGIDFRVSEGTLDEAPGAYKNIKTVMKEQEDLVDIIIELHPILPIKAEEQPRRRKRKRK